MAAGSKNYFIAPEDGWVLVVDGTTPAITYLRASAFPNKHTFYIHIGAAAPTAPQTGIAVPCGKFWFNGSETQKVWIKVPNPVPDATSNGKLRLDIYTQGGALQ